MREVESANAGFALDKGRPLRKAATRSAGRDVVSILSVSPLPEDHHSLEDILGSRGCIVQRAFTMASGVDLLQKGGFSAVVCEKDLTPVTWREMLAEIERLPRPPFLIVTSRLADEHLWAEALNLGAYDVLAKPFHAAEVTRVIHLACCRWKNWQGTGTRGGVQAAGSAC